MPIPAFLIPPLISAGSNLLGNILGGQQGNGTNPFAGIFGAPGSTPQTPPVSAGGSNQAAEEAAAAAALLEAKLAAERKAREAEEAAKTKRMWNTVGVIAIATAGLVALIAAIKALTKRRPMRWTTRRRSR